MAEFTFVVVFAIFAFVLVTILALVMNPRLRARIKLPGHAKQVLGDGNTIQIGATLIIFRERRK
jgi:hypothetical protein